MGMFSPDENGWVLKEDAARGKILMFVIGVIVGAIGAFYIYS